VSEEIGLWIALAVAVFLCLLASAAKSAFTHARLPYLIGLASGHNAKADQTIQLFSKDGLRTALRLGLIICHFIVAAVVVLISDRIFSFQNYWLVALVVFGAFLILSTLEFLIERKILDKPDQSAITWTGMAAFVSFILSPLTHLMTSVLGEHAEKVTLTVTDETLRDWVENEQPESTLEKGEREMIYSIFRFSETMAKEIMVPRMDVLALDVNTTISDARHEFIKAGHSRVPVYEDSIDNVVGLLYAKDLLAVVDGADTIAAQRRLLRQAYFVPEAKKVDELLTEMQSRGVHMVLVVDEYGGVAGVVTLEDIVEEIVGEIRDEYDQGEEKLYEQLDENTYLILGRATIDEFNLITDGSLSDEYADTLGGFIYGQLGRVPQPGEVVTDDKFEFTVEQVVARRIIKVKVRKLSGEDAQKDTEDGNADK
jgi:CBS domain containing-hemolysin-like protein